MSGFRTSDGRDVFIQEAGVRARRGMGVLLSGEGLPTLFTTGSRDLDPSKFLEIQNRSGTAYDTVTRVNLGLVELEPGRSAGDSLNIFGGGFPGTGVGPYETPGSVSEGAPPGIEGDTAVWLVSTREARYVAVLPVGMVVEDVAAAVSEAIEGPFVVESVYGSNLRVAEKEPVPGWTLFTERLVEPRPGPGLR
jgi:hypothetical protein